ncbi:MAG TPA: bifunctional enoyl-CoA hydratase/phosphate acetyltransferase [Thermotogota bacterium]|nr:bifunctional enoyl-CoA hydratase/phosphate acetyltransferase [Thermotogota bacterium]HRW92471.1 bifunctional enoyl-CoA hydratase/phosphate acetyltransferase [Thermotogota bacterium]
MKSLQELVERVRAIPVQTLVLAGAQDQEAVRAVESAHEAGLVSPLFVGNRQSCAEWFPPAFLDPVYWVEASSPEEISQTSVQLVSSGKAQVLMKGMVKTSTLLKAVLHKDWGLRTGRLLSHVAVADIPSLQRLLFISDGGMNVKPDVLQKVDIICNAVDLAHSLQIEQPKVACITAVEVVNPSMPETLDAAILSKMNQRGQIPGCVVEGPLGLDNALDLDAAEIKKVQGTVAGRADILLVPDIHSGNFLGKSAEYMSSGTIAGIVLGAKAPVVIVSRADKQKAKFFSIVLALCHSSGGRQNV